MIAHSHLKFPLIFIVLIVFSCQQDDDTETTKAVERTKKFRSSIVSPSEVPDVIAFIKSKSNGSLAFTLKASRDPDAMMGAEDDNLILTKVLTNQINRVTNSYGISNYTFQMEKHRDRNGYYFLNLVVKEYRGAYFISIVKYVPDDDWLRSRTQNFSTFSGSMHFYNDTGTHLANMSFNSGASTSFAFNPPCGNNNDGDNGWTGEGGIGGSGLGELPCIETFVGCGGSNSDIVHPPGPGFGDACGVSPNYPGSYWTTCEENDTGYDGTGSSWNNAFNDYLQDPCGFVGSGGGGSNNNRCAGIAPCSDELERYDQNCNCVRAEAFGNSNVGVIPEKKSHMNNCDKLKKITDNNATKRKIATLISNSNTRHYEQTFRLVTYNGQQTAGPILNNENGGDCAQVDINVHQSTSAIVHSHPVRCSNGDVFGMFSGGDIMVLAKIAKRYNDGDADAMNNYREPTIMLAYKNTVFALNLDNNEAMNTLVAIHDDPDRQRRLKNRIDERFNMTVERGQQSANIGDLMKGMLKILNDFNLHGLSLYQADVDNNNMVTSWFKKKLNANGTLSNNINCN